MTRSKNLRRLGNGMIHVSGKNNTARHVWLSRLNPENIEISRICSQLIHKAICIINALQALAEGRAELELQAQVSTIAPLRDRYTLEIVGRWFRWVSYRTLQPIKLPPSG